MEGGAPLAVDLDGRIDRRRLQDLADEDRQGTFWVASCGELDAFDRKSGKVTRGNRSPICRSIRTNDFSS